MNRILLFSIITIALIVAIVAGYTATNNALTTRVFVPPEPFTEPALQTADLDDLELNSQIASYCFEQHCVMMGIPDDVQCQTQKGSILAECLTITTREQATTFFERYAFCTEQHCTQINPANEQRCLDPAEQPALQECVRDYDQLNVEETRILPEL